MKLSAGAVALFGGSFDPVHRGHVRLVEETQNQFHFKPLTIVPSGNPPHKPAHKATAHHRLKMAEFAFSHIDGVEFSTFEIERSGPGFAIDTIRHFRKQFKDRPLFFVLGADAFDLLPSWHSFPEVLESCSYLVISRSGWDAKPGAFEKLEARLVDFEKSNLGSRTAAEAPVTQAFVTRTGTQIFALPLALPSVSSTQVRETLAAGKAVADLVPPAVAEYLHTHRLYCPQPQPIRKKGPT